MTVFIVIKRLLFSVGIAIKDQRQSCVFKFRFYQILKWCKVFGRGGDRGLEQSLRDRPS